MLLSKLVSLLGEYQTKNFEDMEITGLSYNSLTTKRGDIFICIRGEAVDGHKYAQSAVEKVHWLCFVKKNCQLMFHKS